ncbi:MAG: capsule biosynthesis protein [Hyphomicrobiaceae bacterium]|nr:capsule biosynthesis protein [Hyphomicrobiaceae bacterium]
MTTKIERPDTVKLRAIPLDSGASRIRSVPSWQSALRLPPAFVAVVVAPMAILAIYLALIASHVYESEAHFVVRSASGSSGLGSIAGAVQTTSFSRANDDTHSVNAYIMSRDAVERLTVENGLLEKLSRPGADFWQRFPRPFERATREQLMKRLDDFISVGFDASTGIATLKVRAFDPHDAKEIATALTEHSEQLINKLNVRARADAIRFASEVVTKAEQRVETAQNKIADFRAAELVFDPGRQSAAAFELISALTGELAGQRAALAEAIATAPNSPQISALKVRIGAFEKEIDTQRKFIVGGEGALAPKLARYEQLSLERELATKALTSALLSLENARQDAQRQQLYLERIVSPGLPDQAAYPKRVLILLGTLFILLCTYASLKWLWAIVMEHDA